LGLQIDFLRGQKVEIVLVVPFTLVDDESIPETDVAIVTSGHDKVFVTEYHINVRFVALDILGLPDQTLEEHAFPEQERTVFGGGDHFAVGEGVEGRHIGKFDLTEFGDLTFELQSGEGFSDFPESNHQNKNKGTECDRFPRNRASHPGTPRIGFGTLPD
jgi:hypothetical protein